jgi:RimJ/RimL family protein N-acetyltransferase
MHERQFREQVTRFFTAMKDAERGDVSWHIPIYRGSEPVARLRPVGRDFCDVEVDLIACWRNQNREAFLTSSVSTRDSARSWLELQIINRADRILFLAETPDGAPFGHIGLTNFNFQIGSCELDNWIRGRGLGIRGGMTLAIRRLMDWVFFDLGAQIQRARVFSNNSNVLQIHHGNGLREEKRVPLVCIEENSTRRWVEAPDLCRGPERDLVYLRIHRQGYEALNVPDSVVRGMSVRVQ